MGVVIALSLLFVYLNLASDLDESIDNALRARADDVAVLISQADSGLSEGNAERLTEAEDNFAQVLTPGGRVFDAGAGATQPILSPTQVDEAMRTPLLFDQTVDGLEGEGRFFARSVEAQDRTLLIVVGTSIDDRNKALDGLVRAFGLGGPIAVLLASGVGYLLASMGLSPIEAMRQRAQNITLDRRGQRLPLPPARDEVHRLAGTLNSMLARLEESFDRERRFVADASHELRTPVAILKAELEVTLRDGNFDALTRNALTSAIEETDRLTRLAEDLLLISRSEERQLSIDAESVDLAQLLEKSRQSFAERARRMGRTLKVNVPPGLSVQADPMRLLQAVNNLADNALSHGSGDVELRATSCDAVVEITVSDQGAGFSSEFVPHAFDRFTRADPARGPGGSGLGLAIVRAIALAHGGEVAVKVGEQRGATIRLRLPRAALAADSRLS